MPRIGSGGRGDDLKRRRPPIPLMMRRRRAMMMVAALIMAAAIGPAPSGVKIEHRGHAPASNPACVGSDRRIHGAWITPATAIRRSARSRRRTAAAPPTRPAPRRNWRSGTANTDISNMPAASGTEARNGPKNRPMKIARHAPVSSQRPRRAAGSPGSATAATSRATCSLYL